MCDSRMATVGDLLDEAIFVVRLEDVLWLSSVLMSSMLHLTIHNAGTENTQSSAPSEGLHAIYSPKA